MTGNIPGFDIASMFNDTEQCEVQANPYQPGLIPLDREPRVNLTTAEAAQHLNRRPQTLRHWAMRDGSGPLRPTRIHGRLAWAVSDLRRVLGVAQ